MRAGWPGGFALASLAFASACSKDAPEPPPKVAAGDEHIECALGPGVSFTRDCAIERSRNGGVYRMIVRHPDGGFRRFEVGADNTIAASDGAEAVQVTLNGEVAEATVGEDRYRIPLERRADAPKP